MRKRRVTQADFKKIEAYIKDEKEARAKNPFRASHERIWTEVDRQVAMDPPKRVSQTGKPLKPGWHSAIELGELSKASEIITADVMRIVFPDDQTWFEPHVKIARQLNEGGEPAPVDPKQQGITDGVLRSLMVQQHRDFGLKARFKMSVKECLHHGSFVAVCDWADELAVEDGDMVRSFAAPVWTPYSMWNAWPDPSPSVHGTNLFYNGSMILRAYKPLAQLRRVKGDGWMTSQFQKIPKQRNKNKDNETDDVELLIFIGDLAIDRADGDDIWLPNSKFILANGTLVYYDTNSLPHSPVIFNGYERQDIRDPYYTSPLIKQSPMQKFTTQVANRFLDAVDLKTTPPIEYDGNDPEYVQNGGPEISPGAATPTRSMGKGFKTLEVGDPNAALEAMMLGMRQLQEGTGVSSIRTGVTSSDRQTATEVRKVAQGAEVRTIDFVSVLEPGALRPFLYMQHALNRKRLERYEFYNSEMHTPDWVVATRKNIDFDAHFDIVGSKGLLGEEQRTERVSQTVAFASSNPLFAPLLKPSDILLQMFRNAGEKSPEQYVQTEQPQIPAEVQAQMQQMQQMLQALQVELQKRDAALKSKEEELALKAREQMQEQRLAMQKAQWEHQEELRKQNLDFQARMREIQMDAQAAFREQAQQQQLDRDRMIHETTARAIETVNAIPKPDADLQSKVGNIAGQLETLGDQLVKAIADLRDEARNARVKKMTPILNDEGDVIGSENETFGGDRYRVTLN